MATAKTVRMQDRQPARWGRNLLLLGLVIAVALAGWFWTRMRASSQANASYAAQTACLCRYVSGRSLDACRSDPGVARAWVRLSENASARSISAGVPALASQTARWSPAGGCVLDPWKD